MFCCLICLCSLEFSEDSSVTSKDCGHVFHSKCITTWLQKNQNCPKCRNKITESSLIKLYFGKCSNDDDQDELKQEITDLLDESENCRNRIQMLMQEMNKDVNIIEQNARDIAAKKRRLISPKEHDIVMKNPAILLSRSDELRRIQAYMDGLQ